MKITSLVGCVIAVAVNQWLIVDASRPGQVDPPGVPSVCVYPLMPHNEYRCNNNEKVSEAEEAVIKEELHAVLRNVIDWVWEGDVDSLMEIYLENILYKFGPATLLGHAELKPFLKNIIGEGGVALTETNIEIRVLSHRRQMLVGGDWSFSNGFHGKFIVEDWYKQDDGNWRALFVNVAQDP